MLNCRALFQCRLAIRALPALLLVVFAWTCPLVGQEVVRIGSKNFTESVILGDMLCHLVRHQGLQAEHKHELGGTQIVWQSLLKGEIDAYVEYTGTLKEEILAGENVYSIDQIRDAIGAKEIVMTDSLGFNNTYALGMRESQAAELNIERISDLAGHPELSLGLSEEFVDRRDGWQGLKLKYNLPFDTTRGLDHSLAYRGVWSGSIDIIDLYSTDPEIAAFDLRVLEDDKAHFPMYEAVIVYRLDLADKHPKLADAFRSLVGKLDNKTMIALNKASRMDREPEQLISAKFLRENVDASIPLPQIGLTKMQRAWSRLATGTIEHLILVTSSLMTAIMTAIPLGVLAYKKKHLGEWILGIVGIIQTIPSMAMLVFMIPLLGLGAKPAILALFLYSLLPIVRGTYTGLNGLAGSIHESALALGLPGSARLRLIELPLAAPSILAGIKTSAVINVGTATIGALIGAGGYGQPIITGIRLADFGLILQGAVPAAILALAVQYLFTLLEHVFVPKGLRV
ncbi:MAG TPA: amino acid ABC transporter permease [Planctomycetaceae bacterium]|nr:amino acid ABC transporter permease [Planctomycetaceae bacterium]